MKQVLLRKFDEKQTVLIKLDRRAQLKLTTGLSDKRIDDLDKYIRNSERGRLTPIHDGADVTRPINQDQVDKFQECKDCQAKPVVFFPWGKYRVGVCAKHWVDLAPTVIGWTGQA